MDYTTQGDPNQVISPVHANMAQATAQNQLFCTNNFSFQTAATDVSTRLEIKFSMPDT